MKSFLAKLLIILCLFSFTPMKEVMKVPLLLAHYMEHLKEKPEMTIGDFFDMHYMHGIVFDDDYEKDMQLPFKVMDFTSIPVFVLQEIKEVELTNRLTVFIVENKLNTTCNFHLSDAKLKGIFHPPKVS